MVVGSRRVKDLSENGNNCKINSDPPSLIYKYEIQKALENLVLFHNSNGSKLELK